VSSSHVLLVGHCSRAAGTKGAAWLAVGTMSAGLDRAASHLQGSCVCKLVVSSRGLVVWTGRRQHCCAASRRHQIGSSGNHSENCMNDTRKATATVCQCVCRSARRRV
jgi:hypothetical protein